MITKQIVYNYLNYLDYLEIFSSFKSFKSFKILNIYEPKLGIINVKYEYFNGEFIATGSYYIYVKLINDWLISQRKEKLKILNIL
jgi:hypothetical protein